MRIEAFIARRFFSYSKSSISGIVIRIAVLSVAIGVAVMIAAVSIVIGFKTQIRDKVIGFASHIQIEALDNNASYEVTPVQLDQKLFDLLYGTKGIVHVQGVANKAGIIKTDEQIQGIVLKGVGPDYDWKYMSAKLISGSAINLNDTARSDEVIVSKILADKLMLKTGDDLRVWFVSNDQHQPRGRRFTISGIYETGLTEFDELHIFGDIRQVQRLNQWDSDMVGTVELKLDNLENLVAFGEMIDYQIPADLVAYTARQTYPHIFDWLDLQDMNVVVIIVLMVLVAGITMISTLLIIILERTSMIGVLKAMGAANAMIRRIFLVHSLDILVRGLLIGNAIGIGFCLLQYYGGFLKLPSESYYLSAVPIDLSAINVLLINLGTIFIWFVMLLIPTVVISRIVPSKAIRFN
ncbi:MAG: ABC transporter permease [Bacteroidetes bacterium]|nr:ABC transporter permease [Bacteroidota bacterium]